MSRSYKDAPYSVREKRLGITDKREGCTLCAETSERTITTGFTAIFFAHEVRQIEDFLNLSQEQGYSAELHEVHGYLGTSEVQDILTPRYSRKKSAFEGYLDPKRAIYSVPRGVTSNLIWNGAGRFIQGEAKLRLNRIFGSDDSYDYLFSAPYHVSHKQNIFTVISISKETKAPRYNHHYHSSDSLSYLLYGHCHCSWCSPDEKGPKTRIRAIANELRNAFNSGDFDAIEEISAELIRTSTNGYRDTMNC